MITMWIWRVDVPRKVRDRTHTKYVSYIQSDLSNHIYWCFWTLVLEKTLESLLDPKEIQPVNPKGNQSWIFIGRTDVEAETSILWPPGARADSFEKTMILGKLEGRRRRGQQRKRWLDGITNSEDRGTWRATVHGVTKSQTNWACRHRHIKRKTMLLGYHTETTVDP